MGFHRRLFSITEKSKTVAIIFGLTAIIEGILWYFLPLYFESRLNSMLFIGILMASHPLASIFADLPAGDICDKIGRKFAFILGLIGFLFSFIFLYYDGFLGFFIFMIIYGIFSTVYAVSANTAIVDHSERHHVGESVGVFTSLLYAGWFIGSIIAGVLISVFIESIIFVILILSTFTLLATSIFFFPGNAQISVKNIRKTERVLLKDCKSYT